MSRNAELLKVNANGHVPDPLTGELLEPCDRCREVNIGDVENLEKENRRLLRRIRKIEADDDAKRKADPERGAILALIDRWKVATDHPRANANAADRFDVIKARLAEGYTVEQIELAIDGIGAYPYVANAGRSAEGTPGQRHDRLGIAIGSGEALERFANLGAQARRANA